MGVANKQRRAAKRKAEQRRRAGSRGQTRQSFRSNISPEAARALLVDVLREIEAEPASARPFAEVLLRPDGPLPPLLTRQALSDLLADLVATAVTRGWRPTDLVQIALRKCGERHLPGLLALVADEQRRHREVAAEWRADLAAAGSAQRLDLAVVDGVQAALELARCLAVLPRIAELIPPPGRAGTATPTVSGDAKLLGRVRALLAKAEATEFPEEAELFLAKAQELVSRHALDRLLIDSDDARVDTSARRIWINPPYMFAKSMLVHEVAGANRCRSVVSEGLGFCTVVGRPHDLDAVELLVTSLLVQASAAMLRHGRHADRTGTSRTRSFRQSFLVSFASRIGERLRAATDQAAASTGRTGELVPVLRRQSEQVDAAFEALFPQLVSKEATVGNTYGWAAGRAAADLAELGTEPQLERAVS